MQAIDEYRLDRHPGPYASWPQDTPVYKGGWDTGIRVPGYVLDAQYRTPLGDLLVTSYDCPFEEASTFILLDPQTGILARADLAAPYDRYLLVGHWPIDSDTLALHYAETLFYRLSITAPGGWFGLRRRPRLKLKPVPTWRADTRMRQAAARRAEELEAIRAGLGATRTDGAQPALAANTRAKSSQSQGADHSRPSETRRNTGTDKP